MTASESALATRTTWPVRAWFAPALAMLCIAASFIAATCTPRAAQATEDGAQEQSYALQQSSAPMTDASPDELQQLVESTATEYSNAVAHREEIQGQLEDTQARIQELDEQLPGLRDAAAATIESAYKYRSGVDSLALLLSADDFGQFLSILHALNAIEQDSAQQIQTLLDAQAEMQQLQDGLQSQLDEATRAEQEAGQALERAKDARAQALAAQQAALEAQRRAIAAAQAQQGAVAPAVVEGQAPAADLGAVAADVAPAPTEAPAQDIVAGDAVAEDTGVSDPGASAPADVSISSDRDAFIAQWAPRIDAYLAGSAMGGQGSVFAAAAWDYGVDPRISPAIACVESGKGAYCFHPYNAWGWGAYSWSDWTDAIYGHVGGFSRGYGSTLDYDDALSYCPPNADFWYNSVLSEMAQI